jgi:carbamate kinase
MRLVVALGGNAMTAADGSATPQAQRAAIESAADALADLVVVGHELVITHGNGPQVGNLLVKNELAAHVVPPVPLDWCDAQTQGTIGALLLDTLDVALAERGSDRRVAVLVSRVLVDVDDLAFHAPSKPIGRYLSLEAAQVMVDHGQVWQDRGERGWRRVVASPEPIEVLDAPAAASLLQAGYVVVAAGGGGIPTLRERTGNRGGNSSDNGPASGAAAGAGASRLVGVEAVIDKDLTAALLARTLDADLLVIATDVTHAVLGFGTCDERPLGAVRVGELRTHAAAGEFAGGSMGPKVEAVCRFVEATGRPAVITSLAAIGEAVTGTTGTRVSP